MLDLLKVAGFFLVFQPQFCLNFRGSWNIKAIDGIFIEHSTKKQAFENLGFDVKSIVKFVLNKTKHNENFMLKQ